MKPELCYTQWENKCVVRYVLRHESLLHDIIEGRMRGTLNDLMKGTYVALKRTAEDRKEWQKLKRAESHAPASQQIT